MNINNSLLLYNFNTSIGHTNKIFNHASPSLDNYKEGKGDLQRKNGSGQHKDAYKDTQSGMGSDGVRKT